MEKNKKVKRKRNTETSSEPPEKKLHSEAKPVKRVHFQLDNEGEDNEKGKKKKKSLVKALPKKSLLKTVPKKSLLKTVPKKSAKQSPVKGKKPQGLIFKPKKLVQHLAKKKSPEKSSETTKKESKKKESKPNIYELTKKQRKVVRQKAKPNYELSMNAKKLWETVRRSDTDKAMNENLISQLHNMVKGKVRELIYAHDTSRVIECLMIVGSEPVRTSLFNELKDEIVALSKSKYAKFFVMKILKYGTKEQKNFVISSFHGKVIKLMKHAEASVVIESAYNEFANAAQRASLIEEIYGPAYALFKDQGSRNLDDLMKSENAESAANILSHMKEVLSRIIEKALVQPSIIHHGLYEFFCHCSLEDKQELIKSLQKSVVEILHSKDGSRVAMQCIWHGSTKDRKNIVKNFKTHVTKICKEEHGHMVLLAIFDSVDDTQLVNKIIVSEIEKNLKEIIFDPNGRKVILHLLSPRNRVHCHPDVMKILEAGDSNQTSKKDKEKRSAELLENISPALLDFMLKNLKEMIFSASSNVVAQEIIKYATGDLQPIYTEVVKIVAEPFTPAISEHILEHTAGHLFLKHLIQRDLIQSKTSEKIFCEHLIEEIPEEEFLKWIHCNRSAFALVWMYECGNQCVKDFLNNFLKPNIQKMKGNNLMGVKVLLKKLKES